MSEQPPADDWYGRAPVPVVGLVLALGVTAVVTVFDLATGDDVSWGGVLTTLAGFTVVYTLLSSWQRRRARLPGVPAADRAVRSGELPADVEPAQLRAGLLHVKRSLRRAGRAAGVLLAGFVTVVVVVSPPQQQRWLGAALVVLVFGAGLLFLRLRTRRVDRLLARLDAQPVD